MGEAPEEDAITGEGSVINRMPPDDVHSIRQAAELIHAAWPDWRETIEDALAEVREALEPGRVCLTAFLGARLLPGVRVVGAGVWIGTETSADIAPWEGRDALPYDHLGDIERGYGGQGRDESRGHGSAPDQSYPFGGSC